jgi:hypothetical protein
LKNPHNFEEPILVNNVLFKFIRYAFLLSATAGFFLLFSCYLFEETPEKFSPNVPNIPASDNTASLDGADYDSIILNGLANQDVFLVKVNTSDGQKNASVVPVASVAAAGKNGGGDGIGEAGTRVPAGTVTIDGQTITRYEMQWQIPPLAQSRSALTVNRSVVSNYTSAKVDDTKSFYINHTSTMKQETATLKKIGAYCRIWVVNGLFDDTSSTTTDNRVTQTQIDTLATKFDVIYPVETNLLGYEYGGGGTSGGMDGDDKIQILVYDIDDDYNKQKTGMVLGYFYTGDEYQKFSVNNSNEAEIFYLDSEALDETPNTIYSTLIHEFNHMINYNVKVIQTNNNYANYEAWYTEMLSMLAEDAIGPLVEIPYDPSSKNGHVILERIPGWLNSYASFGVMQWTNNNADVLNYYASNYAFGAYLVRNFGGPALLSHIAKSNTGGRTSLDASLRALNGPAVDSQYALTRFGEALVYSGSKKPVGVYSFDNTVSENIGGTDYTFSGFDIWNMDRQSGGTKGPVVYLYDGTFLPIPPYAVQLFSRNDWLGKSGSLSVQVANRNPDMHYFVMVR